MTRTNSVVTSRIISVGLAFAVSSSFHGVTTTSKPRRFRIVLRYSPVQRAGDLPQLRLRAPGVAPGASRAYTVVIRWERSFCIDAPM